MVPLLIVTRMTSQYFLSEKLIFVCVKIPISGVLTTHCIILIFLQSFAFEDSCNILVMQHSLLMKLASAVLTLIYKTKYDLMIALLYRLNFSIPHAIRTLLNLFFITLKVTWSNLV